METLDGFLEYDVMELFKMVAADLRAAIIINGGRSEIGRDQELV